MEASSAEWLDRLRLYFNANIDKATTSQPHHDNLKRASVLVLLDSEGHVLLNQRSLKLKSHPGEICFPGGKQDPEDDGDDVKTALRECYEEVGLQLQKDNESSSCSLPKVEILGAFRTIESLHHLCVTPIVAWLPHHHHSDLPLTINEKEVSAAFWAPLEFFVQHTPLELYPLDWSGETFWYRNYSYSLPKSESEKNGNKRRRNGRPQAVNITGLTAHVAYEVAKIAHPSSSNGFVLLRQFQRGKAKYWTPKCFVFSSCMLHQYDCGFQRDRKQNAANKKNRLALDKTCQMVDYIQDKDYQFAFEVIVLEGKITWTLAATSKEEKEAFQSALLDHIKDSETNDSVEADT